MELIRTLILLIGWPILIAGSIFLFYRTYRFYIEVRRNVWGKLVLSMVVGWLLTMYSLGIVSTLFLFVAIQIGTYVVLPIFGLWFITMILITQLVLRWNKEAVEVNKFNMQLQTMVDEKTKDLSFEKQMAEAERNKLAVVVASITDGIMAIDLNKNIILANRAIEHITGYKPENLIGKKILDNFSFSENGAKLVEDEICPIRTDGFEGSLVQKENIILKGNNNTTKHIKLTVSQIKESLTAKLGCIMTMHDISKDEELEEMKLDFVSMAAHELRTPLTSIRGYISLLKDEFGPQLQGDGKEFINRLSISSENLGRLIDNLLNVSRIEHNSFKIEMEPVDIVPIVRIAVTNIMQQAHSKNQSLTFEDPTENMPQVMADGFRISQVMTNLLANAVNYTQEGGSIFVNIKTSNNSVQISVQDTGQGIPKEAMSKLFTKFFRISGVLEQGSKGNGLGLYITKSIIDLHKGTIAVVSELDKGTTFTFSLPFATEEDIKKFKLLSEEHRMHGAIHNNLILNKARIKAH